MRARSRHSPGARLLAAAAALLLLASACGGGGGGSKEASDTESDSGALETSSPGERAVQVTGTGKVHLFGTFTVPPAAARDAVPGVLLVPTLGSGDRDGPIAPTGIRDALGADLAKTLSDAGVASYRYDRRGTGESKLDPGTRLSFDDMVADARAALDLLAQRKETSGRDLAVVGYDQGGLVALRLAATDVRVKRLVLISTPGRSVADIQAASLAAQYGPESAEALRTTVANLLANRILPPIDAQRSELRPLFPPENAPFLAEVYGIDPTADASKVRARALIVVPTDAGPYDSDRLAAGLPGAEVVTASRADPTLVVIKDAPVDDVSNPASPVHEHGAGTPSAPTDREAETLSKVTAFLTAA